MRTTTNTATAVTGSTLIAGIAVALALTPTPGHTADPQPATMGTLTRRQLPTRPEAERPRPLRPVAPGVFLRRPEAVLPLADPLPASVSAETTTRQVTMSVGTGQLIRLPRPITGMFIADDKIADVQVKSPTQIYLFAKAAGETSIYCTDKSGAVVWSSGVRVGNNIGGVGAMLRMAMPDAAITATPINGMVMLTGTVASPKDIEEAQRLTEQFTATSAPVLNRLRTATPMQVNLQVKIVEVSRSVARDIGANLLTQGNASQNPRFGIFQGNPGSFNADGSAVVQQLAGTTLSFIGRYFGSNLLATLQLYENQGLVSTLAEPNLTTLSGETASFLAGGEIPVPQSQGLGAVSVEFKQYGVSLSFTPTVMSDGRISMRVRPEVSQLSDSGSVKLNGFTIPALTTRRAETTVELGSGQSFMIGGLLQNNHNNTIAKAPFLGDLPILGTLFRSNSFRKQETELMIVITPYLVKPVDAKQIALPTDGYKAPGLVDRVLTGRLYNGETGGQRPGPTGTPAPLPTPAPKVKP